MTTLISQCFFYICDQFLIIPYTLTEASLTQTYMQNELELIAQAQSGNSEAFGKLYDAYIKKIYNFIYYKTWHQETAEDLTSLTFLKALNAIKKFNSEKGTFSSWLYQIARNNISDHFRSLKSTTDIEDAWDIKDNIDILADTDAKLKLEKLREGLSILSSEQREIVILRLWEGLSHKEIADIMQKKEATVKVSYSRAVSKIKKEIVIALLLLPYLN